MGYYYDHAQTARIIDIPPHPTGIPIIIKHIRVNSPALSQNPSQSLACICPRTCSCNLLVANLILAKSAAADLGYCSLKPQQELAISSFLRCVRVLADGIWQEPLLYAALPYAFEK